MSSTMWIILGGAVLTYLTRIGGHLVLSRFERIHPRVEAGLNAVPAAVLTTLWAPALFNGGVPEITAMVVAAAVSFRFSLIPVVLSGALVLVTLRHLMGG